MADKGYHSKEIIDTITKMGFTPLIAQNRNILNENLINKMNNDDKEIYKNRLLIADNRKTERSNQK